MPALRFSEIVGQSDAIAYLTRVAAGGRYANAYLLHGPAGVGKGMAAIAFARALMCERGAGSAPRPQASLFDAVATPESAAPSGPAGDACDACDACGKSRDLQHPDLKFLFPVSGEEKDLDETIEGTFAAWREDPFFTFTYEKAASIRLSITRELLREMAFKPFEADRRVVIVRDADRMREDQYSAMLKSIEEPGNSTVWVLTTSRPARLPATIRSRCQRVRFRAIDEATLHDFLKRRVGLHDGEARLLAPLASGSIGRALQLRDSDPSATQREALDLLALARRGSAVELWKEAQRIMKFGRTGRESLRRMIEFQMLWQRDLLRARCDEPAERFVHREREAEIRREARTVDATEIRRRLAILEESLRSIEGNIAPDATLFSTQSRLADPKRSRTGWPRHPAARWDY
jgi:DNA polymerase-3 subunit delta'